MFNYNAQLHSTGRAKYVLKNYANNFCNFRQLLYKILHISLLHINANLELFITLSAELLLLVMATWQF